ncbi:MAG TPA: hypothetical protein VK874_13925 [Gaiellaceae bacterium]|nr:hypothetical protein [Gaiellaceae bacterium]
MSERGSDIEFDFFDEPPTQEAPPRRRGVERPPPGRGSGRPPRPPMRPPAGFTPLVRLVGLVAFAILIVVLLVFWVQSCRSDSKRDAYRDYMNELGQVATDSEQVGRQLNTVLTTPGIRQNQLQNRLGGLAQQQEQDVARAREVVPPGPLREEHRQAVIALEQRMSGLRRLQDAFQQAGSRQNEAGELLATQMRRFVASDVMWEDLFRSPAVQTLQQEDVSGVEVPDSVFLSDPDLATARAMAPIFTRIRGASTGGTPTGTHGNGLVSTRALPGGQTLRTDQDNTIVATADLAFESTVENSGDSQEVQVRVRLTVEQSPRPIEKQATIDIINPGERKTVVFRNLGQIVQFAQKTQVVVEVVPVQGEQNTQNNSATYPVIFTLTPP